MNSQWSFASSSTSRAVPPTGTSPGPLPRSRRPARPVPADPQARGRARHRALPAHHAAGRAHRRRRAAAPEGAHGPRRGRVRAPGGERADGAAARPRRARLAAAGEPRASRRCCRSSASCTPGSACTCTSRRSTSSWRCSSAGELDLTFAAVDPDEVGRGLTARLLFSEELVAVMSPDHALAGRDHRSRQRAARRSADRLSARLGAAGRRRRADRRRRSRAPRTPSRPSSWR